MLKLIAPGKRRNRYYLIRGRFQGVDIETSTETTDKTDAERFKNELERQILNNAVPGPESRVTLHRAIDLYRASRNLARQYERHIERLKDVIPPDKLVRDVRQADIDNAAALLYPNGPNETRNKAVYTPLIATLNYAAANDWCDARKFKRPKLKDYETRAAKESAAQALLANTTGKQHLLLLWLFKHGTRISGALSIDCARINWQSRTYELYITKTRKWKTLPIDVEVYEALRRDPDAITGAGKLFPWKARERVYHWLTPLCKRLGVQFTPHMARHWLGTRIGNKHGFRATMAALGQASYQSAMRYIGEDAALVRQALDETPALTDLGEALGKSKSNS